MAELFNQVAASISHCCFICFGWIFTKTYMEKRNSNITNLTMFSSGTYEICWLESESLMRVFAVIIPISIMTLLNIISIIRSVIVVCRMKT